MTEWKEREGKCVQKYHIILLTEQLVYGCRFERGTSKLRIRNAIHLQKMFTIVAS